MFITGLLVGLPIGGSLGVLLILFFQGAAEASRWDSRELSDVPSPSCPVMDGEIVS